MALYSRGICDLDTCLDFLEKAGDPVVHYPDPVDPSFELVGRAKPYFWRSAVIFDKVKGHTMPLLIGLYWSRARVAKLLDTDVRNLPHKLSDMMDEWEKNPVEPKVLSDGPVREVRIEDGFLKKLPIPIHALGDAGPYITAGVLITKDPETGARNTSIHRLQVLDERRTAVKIDLGVGRHLEALLAKAEKVNKPLEVSVSIGLDPSVIFASQIPPSIAPLGIDELEFSSALLGRPLELVEGLEVDVESPANAMISIEGEIPPNIRVDEGPFAEVHGYYSRVTKCPTINVKAITHRANPIFQTIISGPESGPLSGILMESSLYKIISAAIPAVKAVHLTEGGRGIFHAVIQIEKHTEGQPKEAIMAAFAFFPFLKMVTVVDEDVDIYDSMDVEWAMTTRLRTDTSLVVVNGATSPYERVGMNGVGGKVGIDTTAPLVKVLSKTFQRAKYWTPQ